GQRSRADALDAAPARDRRPGGLAGTGDAAPALRVGVTDRSVDGALLLPGRALDQGQVAAFDVVGTEQGPQRPAGLRGEGKGQGSRGVPVDAVHEPDERTPGRQVPDVVLDAAQGRILPLRLGAGGDRQQPGRLVYDQQVFVLIEQR